MKQIYLVDRRSRSGDVSRAALKDNHAVLIGGDGDRGRGNGDRALGSARRALAKESGGRRVDVDVERVGADRQLDKVGLRARNDVKVGVHSNVVLNNFDIESAVQRSASSVGTVGSVLDCI